MLGCNNAVDRAETRSKILRGAKLIARELRLPILALCELNPAADRSRSTPLSDLHAVGINERDLDNIVLLHDEDNEGCAQLTIARQRNGPTGRVSLRFRKAFARFEDLHDQ